MIRMNFPKLFEGNKGRGYVFYDCGIIHNNLGNYFNIEDEQLLITKEDMYSNRSICYNIDTCSYNTENEEENIPFFKNGDLDLYNIQNFVIDLDNIWEWMGISQKATAKKLLEKHFILDKYQLSKVIIVIYPKQR